MIRLEIEIKDEKFIFNYEVCKTKFSSSSDICPDNLSAFTGLLKYCFDISLGKNDDFKNELTAKIWMKKNKEKAEQEIKKYKEEE